MSIESIISLVKDSKENAIKAEHHLDEQLIFGIRFECGTIRGRLIDVRIICRLDFFRHKIIGRSFIRNGTFDQGLRCAHNFSGYVSASEAKDGYDGAGWSALKMLNLQFDETFLETHDVKMLINVFDVSEDTRKKHTSKKCHDKESSQTKRFWFISIAAL